MPALVLAEVEVYPEYLDAELMVFERLRDLYGSQPGCRTVRLLKQFDDPTRFALCTEWDEPDAPMEATKAWAESDLLPEALQVVVGAPSRTLYRVVGHIGNSLRNLEPGTVFVFAHIVSPPGMQGDALQELERLANDMSVQPGFLGALALDDAAVEERVGTLHLWQTYPDFRIHAPRYARYKHCVYELLM